MPGRWNATSVPAGSASPSRALAVSTPAYQPTPQAAYRTHFPVGVFWDLGGSTTLHHPAGGTWTVGPSTFGGIDVFMNDQTVSMLRAGLLDIAETNGAPYNDDVVQNIAGQIEADARYNRVTRMVQPVRNWSSNAAATDLFTVYWPDAITHDDSTAGPHAQGIADLYANHPSVIAYSLRDDLGVNVANDGHEASAAAPLARQLQARDTRKRAATAVMLPGAPAVFGADLQLGFAFVYPAGYYANLSPTLEGDFHAARFGNPPGLDWLDHVRRMRDEVWAVNLNAPMWLCIQAHRTEVSASGLRYPTGREIGLQGWLCVGEGITGIYVFPWGDNDYEGGTALGLGSIGSEDRFSGAANFALRMTDRIRAALLPCRPNCTAYPITGTFVTSGGGSSGYPTNYANAYVSTLQDRGTGTKYAVIVNRSTSPATITVTGSGLSGGNLVNLETGVTAALGGTVSLPGLDGSIWRYAP